MNGSALSAAREEVGVIRIALAAGESGEDGLARWIANRGGTVHMRRVNSGCRPQRLLP